MGIDPNQFINQVIVPATNLLQMTSKNAIGLMLGTAASESGIGSYIAQIDNNGNIVSNGGLGPFDMEEITHDDCWKNVVAPNQRISDVMLKNGGRRPADAMVTDLLYAAMMCRIQYSRFHESLPAYIDANAVYAYYKKYWNTGLGAATQDRFIACYQPLIKLIG